MQTFDLLLSLSLMDALQIHGKLRTIRPFLCIDRKVNYECTFSVSQGREKSLLRRHPWVFSGAVAVWKVKPASVKPSILLIIREKVSTRRLFASFANPGARLDVYPSESIDIAFFSRRLQQAQKGVTGWRKKMASTAIV